MIAGRRLPQSAALGGTQAKTLPPVWAGGEAGMYCDPHGPIFIIGCARSGTTWLGRIFARSAGFCVTIEDPNIFPLADRAALHWHRRDETMQDLISLYRDHIAQAGADLYVDKSHQNIWLVELLDWAFPSARYVAIEREPYGTIASMMRHHGVRRHFAYWRRYPLPNRHLGIELDDAPGYDELPLSIKCALRWRSHHQRLTELRETLGPRLHLIGYEKLVEDTAAELARLGPFVGRPLQVAVAAAAPLEKWRAVLSQGQRARIDEVLADVFKSDDICVLDARMGLRSSFDPRRSIAL